MITRRCSERRFFMRPDRETNNAFIYCLALAARKAGVSIVCLGTLSNHYHAVVVDNHGRLPQFLEHFHKLYAKHQNALRGRWEAFWASEQTSVVELVKPEDVLKRMVYAITNPVTGHLVERVHHWPGVESLTAIDHNLPLTATKPIRFFDPENGDLPDVIDLHLRRAPGFERLSHVEYSKLLRDEVAEAEEKAAAERREKGIKLLGRRGVLSQHWNARPGTREPRRGLSPRVACKNTWARIEALQRNQVFIDRYRDARANHLAGREAVFPAGTWWLHRFAGVKRAEASATAPPS
jgi:hypothetical protein